MVRPFLASYLKRDALCDSVPFHAGGSNNRGSTLLFLIRLNAACEQFPIRRLRVRCYWYRINMGRYTFKETKFCLSLGKRKLVNVKCRQWAMRGIPFIDGLGDSNMHGGTRVQAWVGGGSQPGVLPINLFIQKIQTSLAGGT